MAKKSKAIFVNSPDLSVGPLNNANKQQYLFHQSVATTQEGFADLKRRNYKVDKETNRTNYDIGLADSVKSFSNTRKAEGIVNKHVTRELKRKGLNKGQFKAYHTFWSSSPAVKYQTKTGKKKAYVKVKGL